jgi:hypothetical protein
MKYLTVVIEYEDEPKEGIINVNDLLLGGKVIGWNKAKTHNSQLAFDRLKKDLDGSGKKEHNESGFLIRSNECIAKRARNFAMKFKPDCGKS